MKRLQFTVLFNILFLSLIKAQTLEVERIIKVYTCDGNTSLEYVSVTSLSKQNSTTVTDENGHLRLKIDNEGPLSLRFSHVGFNDKVINTSDLLSSNDTIKVCLESQTIVLDEVVVRPSSHYKDYHIGPEISNISLSDIKELSSWQFEEIGYQNGVFIKPSKGKRVYIEKINILFKGNYKVEERYYLRILVPKEKVIGNRILAADFFYDHLDEPLVFEINSSGWKEIEINRSLNKLQKGFMIMIVKVGPDYNSSKAGIPFVYQLSKVDKRIYWAYQAGEGYSVNMQRNTREFVPAIGITYQELIQK